MNPKKRFQAVKPFPNSAHDFLALSFILGEMFSKFIEMHDCRKDTGFTSGHSHLGDDKIAVELAHAN